MKLLLDENLPVKLKFRFLDKGIEAFTISDLKWNSKTNGELLQLMIKEGFSHLVTFDASISFQQNFITYPIPVVIIIAHSNSYNIIMEIFDELLTAISESKVGANTVIHPLKKS
jgi:predicted nuclease of predicted toxin-antitoxin system